MKTICFKKAKKELLKIVNDPFLEPIRIQCNKDSAILISEEDWECIQKSLSSLLPSKISLHNSNTL